MKKFWPSFAILSAIYTAFIPQLGQAQKTRISAALIDNSVMVNSSFAGAKINMFGAFETPNEENTDIVILVRGPERPAFISEKYKIMGLWLGQRRLNFRSAPTFFGIASTRPLEEIAPADTLRLYGLNPITELSALPSSYDEKTVESLKQNYIAQRKAQKLYVEAPNSVKILPGGLFRADIQLPDLTPPGLYVVRFVVFRNKRPLDSNLSTFVVTKVGVERLIYRFSRDHSLLHSLTGIAIALLAGFLSAKTFKRLGR